MTFWQKLTGMILRPKTTLENLEDDPKTTHHGILALMLVGLVYTIILLIFILFDYPAAAPSVLPLSVQQQYLYQIWYQIPLFAIVTCITAGVLMLGTHLQGIQTRFSVAFSRVSFSTTVPFMFTTMLVEFVISILVYLRVLGPQPTLQWLAGDGIWFANLYQIGGILWMFVLLFLTARISGKKNIWINIVLTLLMMFIYGLPIGLFIR